MIFYNFKKELFFNEDNCLLLNNIRKSLLNFSTYKIKDTKSKYVKYKPWLNQDYEL